MDVENENGDRDDDNGDDAGSYNGMIIEIMDMMTIMMIVTMLLQ